MPVVRYDHRHLDLGHQAPDLIDLAIATGHYQLPSFHAWPTREAARSFRHICDPRKEKIHSSFAEGSRKLGDLRIFVVKLTTKTRRNLEEWRGAAKIAERRR
jgi:hypothetical protein